MRNSIEYKVWGRYSLFSNPIMRVGGEKCSYQVPTYQALKGITESIYWKPSITWYIDKVRIVNRISTQSIGIKTKKYRDSFKENDLSNYCYLRNVEYHVSAHFEFNKNRPDLQDDWNENKHHNIAKRVLSRGGRRDIFLGTRECQGYVEPFDFDEGVSFYENLSSIPLGTMVHGINYPDENMDSSFEIRLWQPEMEKGVIYFKRPEDIKTVRKIRKFRMKKFSQDNIQDVDDLYEEIFYEGE